MGVVCAYSVPAEGGGEVAGDAFDSLAGAAEDEGWEAIHTALYRLNANVASVSGVDDYPDVHRSRARLSALRSPHGRCFTASSV